MKYLNVGLLATTCLFLLFLTCQPAKAQFTSDYVFIGASGGYSTLIGKTSDMSVPGWACGGLHVGWEVRRTHFLYRPVFIDLQYFSSKSNTNLNIQDEAIKDTRLGDAVMHYEMRSPLKETQRFLIPSIGFMAGYSGNNFSASRLHGAFYCLGGFKLILKMDLSNSVDLQYKTKATYERYIDDYEDMPNHFYTEKQASTKEKYGIKVGCMFSGELGWELNMDHYDKFKIGVFADIGVSNIMYGLNDRVSTEANKENASEVVVRSYYLSPEMKGKFVIPVMAGMKMTYLFNANIKRNCVSKNCRVGYRKKKRK